MKASLDANRARQYAVHGLYGALSIAALCVFLLTAAAFVVPVARATLPALFPAGTAGGTAGVHLFRAALYTFLQAAASVAVAVAVGIPAAFFLARRCFAGRTLLASLAAVPLSVPALIMALGYISTFGMAGWCNRALMAVFHRGEPPLTFLYSFAGIVLCQGFYNFPLVMVTVADAWTALSPDQADSARLLGAGEGRVFATVTLFQLLSAIVSACIPVFLYCFFSFLIVKLFGVVGTTTLEVALYHAGRTALDFRAAGKIALVETICALAALLAYAALEHRAAQNRGLSAPAAQRPRKSLSPGERAGATLFGVTVSAFFLLPLASIMLASFSVRSGGRVHLSLEPWRRLMGTAGFAQAVLHTVQTALATGALCTVCALAYAVPLRLHLTDECALRHPVRAAVLRTVPLLPMAVSSVVMGLGMTATVRRGTPALLVLAQTALSWPFAFRQVYAPLLRIPQDTIASARLLSADDRDVAFRVLLPSVRRNMLSAFGFCFALSAGDTMLPYVLAIPHYDTLPLLTYRLAGSYKFSEASAAGLLLGTLCIGVFALATRLKEPRHALP